MRAKKWVDWILMAFIIVVAVSGVMVHVVAHKHGFDHSYYVLLWVHTLAALGFIICVGFHVVLHWKWYRALNKILKNKKARSGSLAVLFLDALVLALLVTGIVMIPLHEAAHLGLWHYAIGWVTIVTAAVHIVKRVRFII